MAKAPKDLRPFADQKTSELACTYAALILHDDKQDIDSNKINKLFKAVNLKVEPFWTKVFERALKGKNVAEQMLGAGSVAPAAGGATTTAAPVAAVAAKVEEKKAAPVVEQEEDMDMGGLFD